MAAILTCLNCGVNGEIEVQGLHDDLSSTKIFRYLGHNPFSGHMHYRCPACSIVLLVDPMTVLNDAITGLSSKWTAPRSNGFPMGAVKHPGQTGGKDERPSRIH